MNDNLNLAIKLTQKLQKVIMRMAEEEKDIATEKSSTDYPAKTVKYFFKEDDQGVQIVSATGLLDQVDDLLYALLDYNRVEGWRDADDFESKEMMKLKEVVPPSVFPL